MNDQSHCTLRTYICNNKGVILIMKSRIYKNEIGLLKKDISQNSEVLCTRTSNFKLELLRIILYTESSSYCE